MGRRRDIPGALPGVDKIRRKVACNTEIVDLEDEIGELMLTLSSLARLVLKKAVQESVTK